MIMKLAFNFEFGGQLDQNSSVPTKSYRLYAKSRLNDENGLFTCPASISVWNFLAATPDVVNMEAPLPYL